MKLSVAADEYHHVVGVVLAQLEKMGHTVTYHGPRSEDPPGQPQHSWPVVARRVAEEVAHGKADEGILFCWTGTGVSLAANKVRGIRAALCVDAETARGARLWNNANILCLSLRLTSEAVAREILQTWFNTSYQPNPTDDACLKLIEELDS